MTAVTTEYEEILEKVRMAAIWGVVVEVLASAQRALVRVPKHCYLSKIGKRVIPDSLYLTSKFSVILR